MPSVLKASKVAGGGAGHHPPAAGLARSNSLAACTALLFYGLSLAALAGATDPLINPDAVKHRIDRSAMEIQIQGWSRDLRFPVYPIQVQAGGTGVYYTTNENARDYKEFDFDELRCEIGDADRAVLKLPGYSCADGVCVTKEGAVLGTDPRKPLDKKREC
ncbi:hypothetical protein [Variovorax paradoxus]|uniref:hypothetical protein n=1 Tax=Variovorax paradoxus TaxID=34073 RepID=UPI00193251A6|nr:hypothetical protein INQ48_43660 [Variovorax paradoxus]